MRKGEIQLKRLHKPDRSILLYIPYGIIVLLSNARKNGTFVSYFYHWWCDEMADKDDDYVDDTTHAKQCLRQCVCIHVPTTGKRVIFLSRTNKMENRKTRSRSRN